MSSRLSHNHLILIIYFSRVFFLLPVVDSIQTRAWWTRGRFGFLLMFAITVTGVIGLLYLADIYFVLFFSASSDWCLKAVTRYRQHVFAACFFLCGCFLSLAVTF